MDLYKVQNGPRSFTLVRSVPNGRAQNMLKKLGELSEKLELKPVY